jgi:DNA replication protein DnaC
VEIWHAGHCVARHERCYERHQQVLELDHYLDVFERKPGALAGSTALEQCRAQGRWPASYDRFWSIVSEREGRQAGTRAMIEVLLLSRTCGAVRVRQAVEEALAMGASSLSAIRYLLNVDCQSATSVTVAVDAGELRRYDRPQPSMDAYEQLRPSWIEPPQIDSSFADCRLAGGDGGGPVSASQPIQQAAIQQYARQLYLTTVADQYARLAEEAVRKKQSHLSYLEALLEAEVEERDRRAVVRRIKEAHFPVVKTLEEFDFPAAPHIPVALIKKLSEGEYLERKEPVILIGETGTGKSHLAVALAVAACRQRKRVRFTTAAELVTEMIEAQSQLQLTRMRNRWMRYELIVVDELGYVVMPDAAAELLFQVIAGRAEQAAMIVTTNLPFSEWSTKIPNARLCKAMLDRLTDRAHIIDTGMESYRFRRTMARKGGKA